MRHADELDRIATEIDLAQLALVGLLYSNGEELDSDMSAICTKLTIAANKVREVVAWLGDARS